MIFECPVVSHRKICYEYIPRTLECLKIEPGIFCKQLNDNIDRKSNMHKCRNSTVEFKTTKIAVKQAKNFRRSLERDQREKNV